MTTADVAHLTALKTLYDHFCDYFLRLSLKKEIFPSSEVTHEVAYTLCHYFDIAYMQLTERGLTVRIYKKLRSGKVANHEYEFKQDGTAELKIVGLDNKPPDQKEFHNWSLAITHSRNVLLRYLQRIFFDAQIAKTRVEDTDWIKK